jgi:transcriptional regulator with XRE-family HTH domain
LRAGFFYFLPARFVPERAMIRTEFERRRRGLTQHALADLSGVPQTYISLLERGRLIPTETELDRLAHVLDVTPSGALLAVVTPPTVLA